MKNLLFAFLLFMGIFTQEKNDLTSFRELKKYLPQKNVGDFVVSKASGSSNKMDYSQYMNQTESTTSSGSNVLGASIAEVKLKREIKENDALIRTDEINCQIIDMTLYKNMSEMYLQGFNIEVDEEEDDGSYRQSKTIAGYKGIEEGNPTDLDGDDKTDVVLVKFSFIFEKRFLINIENCPADLLESIIKLYDLSGLKKLIK